MCPCDRLRGIVCTAHCKAPETGCRDGWHGDLCIGLRSPMLVALARAVVPVTVELAAAVVQAEGEMLT